MGDVVRVAREQLGRSSGETTSYGGATTVGGPAARVPDGAERRTSAMARAYQTRLAT